MTVQPRPGMVPRPVSPIPRTEAVPRADGVPDADPIRAIAHFLAQIDGTGRDTGQGVGLGEEVLLRGEVAGIGLVYERSLVHLAAFPTPEAMAEAW